MGKWWIDAKEALAKVRVGLWVLDGLPIGDARVRVKKVETFRGYGASWQSTYRVMSAQSVPNH